MSNRRSGLHRLMARAALLAILLLVVAAGLAGYWYLGPYEAFGAETFVEIEHGMSTKAIARSLASKGVVRSSYGFLLVRLLHPSATLQAGEYRFATAETPWQVFAKIRRGDIFYEEFTVPEGSNMFDIAQLLRQGDTVRADAFLTAAANPAPIHDLDPRAPSLEGYLFPSTYRVTHKTTARELCAAMTAEFRKQWSTLAADQTSVDLHRVVTLASLVEKESALPAERPVIAGLFSNRLSASMPLQCDPTTVYAALLEKRYRGTIHKSDLASTNPYNTYMHVGLPPGPICNPGAQALKAALHPSATDYLYFVARPDGSGGHQFSTTLEAHQRAVEAYRKGQTP